MIIQCSAELWWIINKPRREDIILVDLEVHFVGAPSAEPTKNFRRPVGPRDASKRSRNCTRHLFKLSTSPPEIGLHVWGICNCLSCSLDHNTNLIQLFFTRHTIWFRMLLKNFKECNAKIAYYTNIGMGIIEATTKNSIFILYYTIKLILSMIVSLLFSHCPTLISKLIQLWWLKSIRIWNANFVVIQILLESTKHHLNTKIQLVWIITSKCVRYCFANRRLL